MFHESFHPSRGEGRLFLEIRQSRSLRGAYSCTREVVYATTRFASIASDVEKASGECAALAAYLRVPLLFCTRDFDRYSRSEWRLTPPP